MSEDANRDVTDLTVQLLSAYLANNTVPSGELAGLIATTREALSAPAAPAVVEATVYTPAVSVKKSLASPDEIISLIDGKAYKTLKRHLAKNGLTPEQYRERYNLRSDYPMVAPAYSDHRRTVAQNLGLGRKSNTSSKAVAPVKPEAVDAVATAPKPAAKPAAKTAKKVATPAKAKPVKDVVPAKTASETATAAAPAAEPKAFARNKAPAKSKEPAKDKAIAEAQPAVSVQKIAAAPKTPKPATRAQPVARAKGAAEANPAGDQPANPAAAKKPAKAKAPVVPKAPKEQAPATEVVSTPAV